MTAVDHAVPSLAARPASKVEARIVKLHATLPAEWIDTATAPLHPREGEIFLDVDGQLWRAVGSHNQTGHRTLVWSVADLVSARTRRAVRVLAALAALSALGLFVLGPALLTWVGNPFGWLLLIVAWVVMIAAIITTAAAIEAQSRMVVIASRARTQRQAGGRP